MNKRRIGSEYEEMAKNYLLGKGYTYVTSNYHCRYGEIDLIFKDGDCTVFTEVKFRSNNNYGTPLEAITKTKAEKIIKTAWDYLQKHSDSTACWRIDTIGVVEIPRTNRHDITHIINAIEG